MEPSDVLRTTFATPRVHGGPPVLAKMSIALPTSFVLPWLPPRLRVQDGRVIDGRDHFDDLYAWDAFWS